MTAEGAALAVPVLDTGLGPFKALLLLLTATDEEEDEDMPASLEIPPPVAPALATEPGIALPVPPPAAEELVGLARAAAEAPAVLPGALAVLAPSTGGAGAA